MTTCSSCKYWKQTENKLKNHGKCKLFSNSPEYNSPRKVELHNEDSNGVRCITEYYNTMFTNKNFSCSEWAKHDVFVNVYRDADGLHFTKKCEDKTIVDVLMDEDEARYVVFKINKEM